MELFTLSEADAYHKGRNRTDWESLKKEERQGILVKAWDALRYDPAYDLPKTNLPSVVKEAIFELAYHKISSPEQNKNLKRVKSRNYEEEYFTPSGSAYPEMVQNILVRYLIKPSKVLYKLT